MGVNPTEADLISEAISSRIADIHGPMPAIVQAFYPAVPGVSAATVDCQPVCVRGIPTDAGTLEQEGFPVCPNIPVVYPRGGGFSLTWDLFPGDTVLFVPLYLDSTIWRLTGAVITAPATDQGMHHIAHAVAIPGLLAEIGSDPTNPNLKITLAANDVTLTIDSATGEIKFAATGGSALTLAPGAITVEGAAILIGAGASDFAALSSKCDDEFTAIKTTFASLTGPGSFGTPYTFASASVAASKTKVE